MLTTGHILKSLIFEKTFLVQTILSIWFKPTQKTIQRCVLIVTDLGDLVLDPTCWSGTAVYVAEQWDAIG